MEKEQDKKQYEVSFLLKEEGGLGSVVKFINASGGEIELESPVAKIALAYPIKKETQAYFGYIHFSALPGEIKNLEHEMETNLGVLRHLIITPPFKKAPPRQRPEGALKAPVKQTIPRPTTEIKSETLTNEDLEKKIEEILK